MAKSLLPLALSAIAVAFAGVAFSGVTDDLVPKVTRSSAVAVVRDVCFAQASPRAVLREARRTAGETMRDDALPALLGAGAGDWQVVKRISLDGRPAFLTVGDRGGTSMCRVYFQLDDVQAMAGALPGQIVLGAPLGRPDDSGVLTRPAGWPFVGWHVSRKDGWSSVAYAHDPRSAWRTVEVVRGG
jgi:hypothetical protein